MVVRLFEEYPLGNSDEAAFDEKGNSPERKIEAGALREKDPLFMVVKKNGSHSSVCCKSRQETPLIHGVARLN